MPPESAADTPLPSLPTSSATSEPPSTVSYDPAAMRYHADPLADATIAAIVGTWALPAGESDLKTLLALNAERMLHVHAAMQLMNTWTSNAALVNWSPPPTVTAPPHVSAALRAYVDAARALPSWANHDKIAQGANVFTRHGSLSVMSLFCASLPDTYVQPKASAVLQISGQLTAQAEHRIRSTAAVVYPIMLPGGLTAGEGIGVAQTLKVRLVHAAIRNLILRGAPDSLVNAVVQPTTDRTPDSPLMASGAALPMHSALVANGWNVARDGLPINQEQLLFTLLTFHFVFLRCMRTLGIGLCPSDEEAYLHCWSVVGFVLGIESNWMPSTYADAERLFLEIQSHCLADDVYPGGTDARPALADALIDCMRAAIPYKLLKPFPALLTRYLCGSAVADVLGLTRKQSLVSRFLFVAAIAICRSIDRVVRLIVPRFSLARMGSRVIVFHLLERLKIPGRHELVG
jgi:hypothetical protein